MVSLDNFHNNNNGVRTPLWNVRPAPWDGSPYGQRLLMQDHGGPAGRWDPIHRAPVATAAIRHANPFDRVSLGRDVPGMEIVSQHNPFQTNPYVPLGTQASILPGGNAESWVLYHNRLPAQWSWSRLLPLK